jgi:anti-sigma B factor antagonist
MQFESTKLADDITLITLNGRLDIEGTQAIEQRFSFATTVRAENIVVDLSGLTFLASIGIRLLLTSARAQAKRGGKLVLAAPTSLVRGVLETAGIDQLVPLASSVESARASFSG